MKRTLALSALVASTALFAAGVQASSDDYTRPANLPPQSEWMSIVEVANKFEAEGYKVREIEAEKGAYEVKMIDANGLRVEAYVHPVTGEILNRRNDD